MRRNLAKYVVIAVISMLVGGLVFGGQSANIAALFHNDTLTKTASASSTGPMNVADIVEKVSPAVVYIEASSVAPAYRGWGQFYGIPEQEQKSTGTGFIIDPSGYILTNEHVIDGATSVKVKLQNKEQPLAARVVGKDYELDLAVLKIDGKDLPTIPLGNSDAMRPGDWVVAIGNPLGLDHTVTVGVISAKGRPITIEDRNYKNLIQTDAAINPGNSGGPLINMEGQVIAINTAVSVDAQGIGFAIPINTAKSIMNDLIKNGKVIRPYVGISMVTIDPEVADQVGLNPDTKGVLIVQVMNNSPAEAAGIKSMDILTSIDGKEVTTSSAAQELIQKHKVGDTVKLGLIRDGSKITVSVKLKEKP